MSTVNPGERNDLFGVDGLFTFFQNVRINSYLARSRTPGADNTVRIEECRKDANGYVYDPVTGDYEMPADGVNVCYAALTDPGDLTPSAGDEFTVVESEARAREVPAFRQRRIREARAAAGASSTAATRGSS